VLGVGWPAPAAARRDPGLRAMRPWLLPLVLVWATGAALLLDELRWLRRVRLADRLLPYVAGAGIDRRTGLRHSDASILELIRAGAIRGIDGLSTGLGVTLSLPDRLELLHRSTPASEVRLQQGAWAIGALLGCGAIVLVLPIPALLGFGLVVASPVLAVLIAEDRLLRAVRRRQERVLRELPIVDEQLGMLLGAGYSLSGALERVANRGGGAVAEDLRRVRRRADQGLGEVAALREWATRSGVPAVTRLVDLLALSTEAGDLAHLITEEARSVRQQVHRELVADLDRRAQQVWIPVTVATLVPGTILLAVPFQQAVRMFSSG